MEKPHLFLTIEHSQRELYAKTNLACTAASLGFRVYIGSFRSILQALQKSGPSIVFHKSTWLKKADLIKTLGNKLVFLDEETGFAIPRPLRREYVSWRFRAIQNTHYDHIFTIGDQYKNLIEKQFPNVSTPVSAFGWPRIDLWHQEYKDTYAPSEKDLDKKKVLFISSFGAITNTEYKKRIHSAPNKWRKKTIDYKYKTFKKHISLLREIAPKLNQNTQLIIRPHPSESEHEWKKLTSDLSNVQVNNKGDIGSLALSADKIINCGSTAAVQAALQGNPSICYCPPEEPELNQTPVFEISQQANTPEEMLQFINNDDIQRENVRDFALKILKNEVANADSPTATSDIANCLYQMVTHYNNPVNFSKIDTLREKTINYLGISGYFFSKPLRNHLGIKQFGTHEKLEGGISAPDILSITKKLRTDNKTFTIKQLIANLVSIEC